MKLPGVMLWLQAGNLTFPLLWKKTVVSVTLVQLPWHSSVALVFVKAPPQNETEP